MKARRIYDTVTGGLLIVLCIPPALAALGLMLLEGVAFPRQPDPDENLEAAVPEEGEALLFGDLADGDLFEFIEGLDCDAVYCKTGESTYANENAEGHSAEDVEVKLIARGTRIA